MLTIKTDCGHVYTVDRDIINVLGATTDCNECGELLIFPSDQIVARKFHEYMHEKNPDWPKDGANTGFVEIE